jgi:hypothetical protein
MQMNKQFLFYKKTQAAMEFLMTYGWALLVVLIAIAALVFFGLLDPDRFLPEKVELPIGLIAKDFIVNDGEIIIYVMNNIGQDINNFKIGIEYCNDYTGAYSDTSNIQNGKIRAISIPCNGLIIGKKIKSDISISYSTRTYGNELSHSSKGRIIARVQGKVGSKGELGDGSDGILTLSSGSTVVNIYSYLLSNAFSGSKQLNIDTTGFQAEDEIMIIQMQATSGAGNYEIKRVKSVENNILNLYDALENSYVTGTITSQNNIIANTSQVIRIPQYESVIINTGASIIAQPWNGNTGGIIAIKCKSTIQIFGSISANQYGYRGGNVASLLGPESPTGYVANNGGGGAGGTGGHHGCSNCNTCCATAGNGADGSNNGNVGLQTSGCGLNNGGNAFNGGGGGGAGGGYDSGTGGTAQLGGGAGGNKVSNQGYNGANGLTGGGGGGGADRDSAGGGGGGKSVDGVKNSGMSSRSMLVLGGGASAGAGGGGGGGAGDYQCASGGSGGSKYGTAGANGGGNYPGSIGQIGENGIAGGGIILIYTDTIQIDGTILSSGGNGGKGGNGGTAGNHVSNGAGGGGGGSGGNGGTGGSVYILANEISISGSISSLPGNGGNGGNSGTSTNGGNGGSGGNGIIGEPGTILLDYYDSLTSSNINPPADIAQLNQKLKPYTLQSS